MKPWPELLAYAPPEELERKRTQLEQIYERRIESLESGLRYLNTISIPEPGTTATRPSVREALMYVLDTLGLSDANR